MKPKRAGGKRALRNRAERILADKASPASPAAPEELLHELEVHQVELELQVEELRRAEAEIEKMRDRYLSLYDGAPVGYVTLNGYGLITQVNRTAEKILGTARPLLRARRFSSFLDHGSRSTFLSVIADARSSGARRTIDAQLAGANRAPTWVKLDCLAEPGTEELRVTLVDITARRAAERELRQLAEGLLKLQEKERETVSEVLHDDAGQQLTYLTIILDQARESGSGLDHQQIDQLSDVARKILQTIRSLSASLSPAELSRVGLTGAVNGMITEFSARTKIPVRFSATGEFPGLPFEVALAAYRIVQEALTNAARHAQPASVTVSLQGSATQLHVQVQDDGKGFATEDSPMSLGLLSMKERARAAGGRVLIESSTGKGTRISFEYAREWKASKNAPQSSGSR